MFEFETLSVGSDSPRSTPVLSMFLAVIESKHARLCEGLSLSQSKSSLIHAATEKRGGTMVLGSIKKLKISLLMIIFFFGLPSQAKNFRRFILKNVDAQQIQQWASEKRNHLRIERELDDSQGIVMSMTLAGYRQVQKKFPSVTIEVDSEVKIINANSKTALHINSDLQGRAGIEEGVTAYRQPSQRVPWGVSVVGAIQAHKWSKGKGIKVCVIDSGIQSNHPDLKGQVVGGRNFVPQNGVIRAQKYQDDNGHGTHVAGTIAALDNKIGVVGIAPKAKLLALKVLDSSGSGFISDVADAIRHCVKKKAQIASMSIGTTIDSSILREAVYEAARAGLIMVAATGNSAGMVDYPAAYPEVLAVTAMDNQRQFASFSNYGPEVDYIAPGVSVLSTTTPGVYEEFSGTSMATPHVVGVIALALSKKKSEIATQDLGLSPDYQGLGLVDAWATMRGY